MRLGRYQHIHEMYLTTPDTVEQLGWAICIAFNKPYEKVNRFSKLQFFWYNLKLQRQMVAKPWLFPARLQTDATKITWGQFVECQHWLKGDSVGAAHLVAASILKKRGDHKKDAERMTRKHMNKIIPKVAAFVDSMNALIESYKGLFEPDEIEDPEEAEKQTKYKNHPFVEQYGFIHMTKDVATYEGITVDQAYGLPVIQALNDLSYLKSLNSYLNQKK